MTKYASQIEEIIAKAEQQAFDRAISTVKEAMLAALDNLAPPSALKQRDRRPVERKKTRIVTSGNRVRVVESVESEVLHTIEQKPGLKGAEIIRSLPALNPRTIRTGLRRLRMDEKIRKSDEGGWYKR